MTSEDATQRKLWPIATRKLLSRNETTIRSLERKEEGLDQNPLQNWWISCRCSAEETPIPHKCFQNFITRYSQFKKVRNHESKNSSSNLCDPESPDWQHWDLLWHCGTSEVLVITVLHKVNNCGAKIYYSAPITRLKSIETSLQDSLLTALRLRLRQTSHPTTQILTKSDIA